jgi:hypothetical protein
MKPARWAGALRSNCLRRELTGGATCDKPCRRRSEPSPGCLKGSDVHAALITAYKDYPTLLRLVRSLRREDIAVHVHLDRKTRFSEAEMAELSTLARLQPERQAVYWGSYSHLAAIVSLVRSALLDERTTYLHILSGQDFPVGTITDALDPEAIYMDVEVYEQMHAMVHNRIRYRKVLHAIESVRWLYRPLNRLLLIAQGLLGLDRRATRTYGNVFKGIVWLSLPREAARFCMEDPKAQRLLEELRNFYVAEEYFFQTALMNSSFRDRIVPQNRRFTIWEERHGAIPGILDMGDLPAIEASASLFARKVDSRISAELLDRLEARREALLV